MSLLHRFPSWLFLVFIQLTCCQFAFSQSLEDKLLSSNFNLFKSAPPANSFELDTVNNVVLNPARMKDRVIILNFWKIDCSACSMEKPVLERLVRKYSDRGLEVVAVNLFDRLTDLQDYVKKSDHPFTYAFDSHQRYTVNQKRLLSGFATNFVINSESEAIYEIPGLPTTYIIDRTGRVVGYSVGLADWDDAALESFIESLLGPSLTTYASASASSFHGYARQGSGVASGPKRSGPKRDDSVEAQGLNVPTPTPILGIPAAPSLPFQTINNPKPDTSPVETTSVEKTSTGAQESIPVGAQTQKQAKDKNKPKGKQDSPAVSKPKTPAQQGTGVREYPVYSTGPGTAPSAVVNSPAATSGETAARDKSLPPLPPAMPYSPPGRSSRPQSAEIMPDSSGAVVARIPGASPSIGSSHVVLPAAQPVPSPNSIGNSIMDSFSKSPLLSPQQFRAEQQQQETPPPATILGQFTQDIQNLGAGIRDTLGYLIPGKQ